MVIVIAEIATATQIPSVNTILTALIDLLGEVFPVASLPRFPAGRAWARPRDMAGSGAGYAACWGRCCSAS